MATSELDEAALADLRHRYEPSVRTHWADCYKDHAFCAVVRLCDELTAARQRIAEVEGERDQIRRLGRAITRRNALTHTLDRADVAAMLLLVEERATPAAREGE